MKKFIFIYFGNDLPKNATQKDLEDSRNNWMNWFGTFQAKMVDGGNPFSENGKSVTAEGIETIPADKWPSTGYTIINAEDINEATEIAKSCPLVKSTQGAVRVYEAMPM